MEELVSGEHYIVIGESALEKHVGSGSEINRIALYYRSLYVPGHLVQIGVFPCQLIVLQQHVAWRDASEQHFPSSYVGSLLLYHLVRYLGTALGTYALELASVPLIVSFGHQIVYGRNVRTNRTA